MENLISLEGMFLKATECHPDLSYLAAQWAFDKELISKSLQNISSYFPHYSRHDASHSRKLVTNIERMLGERLKYLSATDMWLILEAAYSHDIGMVITKKQLNDLDEQKFKEFLSELADDQENEHHETAQKLLDSFLEINWEKTTWQKIENFKFIIAEWFRRRHPKNSAKIVMDPNTEIGLTSPRNELLPQRLFYILSEICHAHGKSFDETMKLSFKETGMATENCHPRYIACLIRLADLLDVDDNRFCPVMMNSILGGLPQSSQLHNQKHHSIKSFRLDSNKIEIKLECPDVPTFEITKDWFDWLEKEHLNQTRNWIKIVPNIELGSLPTLMKTKIYLSKPYVFFEDIGDLKCETDTEKMNFLLFSESFYQNKYDAVREILQNAFDATIKAIWIKYNHDFDESEPFNLINNHSNEFPINISLLNVDEEYIQLSVSDRGVGFSLEEIKNIFRPSINRLNKKRIKLINEMPIPLRPSGFFNIGIRSYFMLTDSIEIITKHALAETSFKIIINKDNKNNFIEEIQNKSIENSNDIEGTTVSIRIKKDKIPYRIESFFYDEELHSRQLKGINNYDLIDPKRDLCSYSELMILMSIRKTIQHTPLKIYITDSNDKKSSPKTDITNISQIKTYSYYSIKESVNLINFSFTSIENLLNTQSLKSYIYFKGQEVKIQSKILFEYLAFVDADIVGLDAGEILTFNRERIVEGKEQYVLDKIISTCIEFIENKFNQLSTDDEKIIASAFHFRFGRKRNWKQFEDYLRLFPLDKNKIRLGDVFKKIINGKYLHIIEKGNIHKKDEPERIYLEKQDSQFVFIPTNITCEKVLYKYIEKNMGEFKELHFSEYGKFKKKPSIEHYSLNVIKNEMSFPFPDEIIKDVFTSLPQNKFSYRGVRKLFPATGKFFKLAIDCSERDYYETILHSKIWQKKLLLPYVFSVTGSTIQYKDILDDQNEPDEAFIQWVDNKKLDTSISINEIRCLYKELIEMLNNILNN